MKPTVEARKVIAERVEHGWLVMWDDGQVEFYPTKKAVLAAIKRTAKADIDVATIEWRG